jgi:hypothetical protein
MIEIARQLDSVRESSLKRLNLLREEEVSLIPSPGKWSKKQILGHLIDSASNNHQRIVRAKLYPEVAIDGYEQNLWVSSQEYQDISWLHLLGFWDAYNRHLSHLIGTLEEKQLGHLCKIGNSESVSLEFIARDYVRHLQHHLKQILGEV